MADAPLGREFVFKMPGGQVVGRAKNLEELIQLIKTAPLDAVLYHANGKHFSPWLDFIKKSSAAKKLESLAINSKTVRVALLRALRSS
ncbi:MAG: hypothetical protein V1822_01095 [Candidatus Micrarchaeota archaeon]